MVQLQIDGKMPGCVFPIPAARIFSMGWLGSVMLVSSQGADGRGIAGWRISEEVRPVGISVLFTRAASTSQPERSR
jgi:hypothetical protein